MHTSYIQYQGPLKFFEVKKGALLPSSNEMSKNVAFVIKPSP